MPALDVHVGPSPSSSWQVDAASSSEEASLNGHKAKTPVIAGSVCGGLLGIAWIVGFTIYFIKRWKRKKRKAEEAAGVVPAKKKEPGKPGEKIIVPPDPAILLGHRRPGENAFLDDTRSPNRPSTALPKLLTTEQVANLSKEVACEHLVPHYLSAPVMDHQVSHNAPMDNHYTSSGVAIPPNVA